MIAPRVLRGFADPLLDTPVLLALLFFWLLGWIAAAAGIFGLWLLLVVAPAFIRYQVMIVEARALDAETPLVTIELFNPADGLWRLFPLIPVGLVVVLFLGPAGRWPFAFETVLLLGAFLMPLSVALLAVTHSCLESLNPVAAARLLKRLGPAYLWVPLTVIAGVSVLRWLQSVGAADVFTVGFFLYWLTASSALTGRIVAAIGVRAEIDIDAPEEPSEAAVAALAARERQAVLNHAYGLISRGNRAGGFLHLAEYASRNDEPLSVEHWFLDAMFRWENRDAALFYAQGCLGRLLDAGHDVEAMKLIARCLREHPEFRPVAADRERARAVAERLGNADVAASVRRRK